MKSAIVGYTGFVGSNLCLSHTFDACYNSKNIDKAFGTHPDLLVYSGVRAEMFLANNFPDKDEQIIYNAIDNIKRIAPKNIVLISTIGVYESTLDGDEDTHINKENLPPYGRNRLMLENWVSANFPNSLIVRLPAIYGENIKKNFVYDIINYIPSMLNAEKWRSLIEGTEYENDYKIQDNGFYKCTATDPIRIKELKKFFKSIGFSALNFTDSRSVFQFYNLKNLWKDINIALAHNINLLTIATEPVLASELFKAVHGSDFINEINDRHPKQYLKSKYASIFGGDNGWFLPKNDVISDLVKFIKSHE